MPLFSTNFVGCRHYRLDHPRQRMQRGLRLARRLVPLREDDHVVVLPEGIEPGWKVPVGSKVVGIVLEPTGKTGYIQVIRAGLAELERYMNERIKIAVFAQAPGATATTKFVAHVPRRHLSLSYCAAAESLYTCMTSRTEFHKTKRSDGRIASLRELAFDATLTQCTNDMQRGAVKRPNVDSNVYTDEAAIERVQALFQAHGGLVGELLHLDPKLRMLMAHHIVRAFFDVNHTLGRILFGFALQNSWNRNSQSTPDERCATFEFLEAASIFDYVRSDFEKSNANCTSQHLDVTATILKIRADAIRDGGANIPRMHHLFPELGPGDAMLLQLGKNPDGLYFSEHRSYMLKNHGPVAAAHWAFPNFVQRVAKALRGGLRVRTHGSVAKQLTEKERLSRKRSREEAAALSGDTLTDQQMQARRGEYVYSSHSSDDEAEPARA